MIWKKLQSWLGNKWQKSWAYPSISLSFSILIPRKRLQGVSSSFFCLLYLSLIKSTLFSGKNCRNGNRQAFISGKMQDDIIKQDLLAVRGPTAPHSSSSSFSCTSSSLSSSSSSSSSSSPSDAKTPEFLALRTRVLGVAEKRLRLPLQVRKSEIVLSLLSSTHTYLFVLCSWMNRNTMPSYRR